MPSHSQFSLFTTKKNVMKILIISALIAIGTGIISCNSSSSSNSPKTNNTLPAKNAKVGQKEFYVCEMDTDVISNHSGKCPKCGMDLEKKLMPDTTKVTVK